MVILIQVIITVLLCFMRLALLWTDVKERASVREKKLEREGGVWSAHIGSEKDITWVYTLVVNALWKGLDHPVSVKGGLSSLKRVLGGVRGE